MRLEGFFLERLNKLDCSPRTTDIYRRALQKFFEFAGAKTLLRDVTKKQADDFYNVFLVELEFAESYREKTARVVREFFDKAVRFELIDRNPFEGIKITSTVNKARQRLIKRKDIQKILSTIDDPRWKCIVGFAALCGLRTRCEIAALRWEQIHWDRNLMTIPKAKTAERMCPIFGDFRRVLEDYHNIVRDESGSDELSGAIFPNCPSQTQLTNRLKRTIEKAEMEPWPKPWINLRSSCESHLILIEKFDIETVSSWLGNSPETVRKHYLQFMGEDIDRASDKKFANSMQHTPATECKQTKKPLFPCIEMQGIAAEYTRRDSNPQPSVPKTDALSS